MSGVRIYLDVDGVLNAVALSTPAWGWGGESRTLKANGFDIRYSPELVATLNDLTSQPGVETFWLTTWLHDAPALAKAIGLNGEGWPVVGEAHWCNDRLPGWWKLAALKEHLTDHDGPVLWVDDDIDFDREAKEWLADQPLVLAICPATRNGITRAEAGVIERFMAEVAPTT